MKILNAFAALTLSLAGPMDASAAVSAGSLGPRQTLRPVSGASLFGADQAPAPVAFDFHGFLGANVLHGAYWLPDHASAESLFTQARAMNLNVVRVPIPMSLVVNKTHFTEETLIASVVDVLDVADAKGLKVILVMDGYTPYSGRCGYKVGFVEVAGLALKLVRAAKGHPALFAWDLLNEPLSGADGMGCPASIRPSVIQAVIAMHRLIRAEDPRAPQTVGEAYPELQSAWNSIVDFASPHVYAPYVRSPVTEDQLARLRREVGVHIDRLKRDTAGLPLVIGEFGFDPLSQVTDDDQAKAFEAYYGVLREKGLGSLFWQLAVNEYTVLREDGSWRPAADVVRRQAAQERAPDGVEVWECQADGRWYSDGRCYASGDTCNQTGPHFGADLCAPGRWRQTSCGCL